MKVKVIALCYRILGVGLKQGINIAIFFIAAKLLSVEDFGEYNYILAFALLFATLCDFGISTAVSKYVAKARVLGIDIVDTVFGSVMAVVAVMGTALSLILIVFHDKLNIDSSFLLLLVLLIFVVPVFAVFDGIYRGEQDVKALALASIAGVISVIIFGHYFIYKFGIAGALITQLLFYVVGILLFLFRYKRPIFQISKKVIKDITHLSIPLGLIALVYLLYARIDIIMLGLFGYIVEVGYFEMVNKVILMLTLPIQIYAQIETPSAVALWHTERKKVYEHVWRHVLFSIPIFIVMAIAAYMTVPWLISAFFSEYANSIVFTMLSVMLFVFVFQGTSDLIGNTFTVATDHEKFNLKIMAIFAFLNLVFVYFGVSVFGPVGLVYAKVLVYVPYSIYFITLYLRKLKVAPSIDINTAKA